MLVYYYDFRLLSPAIYFFLLVSSKVLMDALDDEVVDIDLENL